MTLYYRALSGRGCEIVPYDDDADLWQHPDTATTIRLPSHAPLDDHGRYSDAAWYQVALTHRALHHTLGTFRLDLARDEPLFTRLRPDPRADDRDIPALERFARLFGRTALAVEVFALCEDTRIDAAAQRLLPGLGAAYRAVRHAARHERPDLALLPPRSAVAEALVRFSLGADSVTAPAALAEPLATVVAAADRLLDPRATVESSAEATIRIYDVLAGLPNIGPIRAVRPMVFADLTSSVKPDLDDPAFGHFRAELRLEGDEKFDVRLVPVRYRDTPGPRYAGQQASGMPLQEAILRMTPDLDAVAARRRRRRLPGQVDGGRTRRRRRDRNRSTRRATRTAAARPWSRSRRPSPTDVGPAARDRSR